MLRPRGSDGILRISIFQRGVGCHDFHCFSNHYRGEPDLSNITSEAENIVSELANDYATAEQEISELEKPNPKQL
jgi:hypothetical protein